MPLVFAAHAGSVLALTGTPVNVLVADAARDAGAGEFGFLEFALVGVPLVAGTVAVVVLFGGRLLPHRTPTSMPADLSALARELVAQYDDPDGTRTLYTRERGVAEVVIPPRSPLIGTSAFPGMATPSGDLVIAAIQRNGEDLGPAESRLAAGDALVLRGPWQALDQHLTAPEVLVVDSPELSAAAELGVSARPVLMSVAVAAAAALLTPVAWPSSPATRWCSTTTACAVGAPRRSCRARSASTCSPRRRRSAEAGRVRGPYPPAAASIPRARCSRARAAGRGRRQPVRRSSSTSRRRACW